MARRSASTGSLETYRAKRDFARTPEPPPRKKPTGRKLSYCIQKHAASRLHYDFRLELDGVLKSWAVPKGPSFDPTEKRLAVHVEDHPIEYGSFEGVIPEGEYGAGPVIVWDAGTFRNLTEKNGREVPVEDAVDAGHVNVFLEGQKLRGGYALTRIGRGKKPRWILVKQKDEHADARRNPVRSQPESVTSGKTIDELAAELGDTDPPSRRRRRTG
jgi:DNA ligase D-like protein (predicted 3'-phosphoesterase)